MTLFDLAVGLYEFDNLTRVDVVAWLDLGKFDEDDEEWPGMKNGGMSWKDKARELVRTQIVFHCEGSLGVYVPCEDRND
jgi:hypothetical protein